jgi:predicted ATP-grasp superfamily ATP-dependent carboligase
MTEATEKRDSMASASASARRAAEESRPLTILMTEGSSTSARQALYALGPRHTIDIVDPSPLCQCRFSRLVRHWYRSPGFTEDPCGYLSTLGRLLRARKYDVVFLPHDEVFLLSRVRETLAQLAAVAIPDFENVARLSSKTKFLNVLDELGLPHPEADVVTRRSELDRWNDFPRFLKLETSTAGEGVRLVRNREELQSALRSFEDRGAWSEGEPAILQRPASGRQSVVRAVFNRGRLAGIHMNALVQRGVGGAAMVRDSCIHPVVEDHIRRLGEHLKWHGPLFADYFLDEQSGQPAYIEANPRIGDTANATLSGVNICQQWIDVALDRDHAPVPNGQLGVRSRAIMLMLLSRAQSGANRRDLVREMRHQWRGTDIYANSEEEMVRPGNDWLSIVPYAWVAGRLLMRPGAADRFVRTTVERYALSKEAAERIASLPLEQLTTALEG